MSAPNPPPHAVPATAPIPAKPARNRSPRTEVIRKLGRVLPYAGPHKGLVVLAMALMAFQAVAGNARIFLLYPIITRVFGVNAVTDLEASPHVGKGLGSIQRKAEKFAKWTNTPIDAVNSITSNWIPDAWVRGAAKAAMAREKAEAHDLVAPFWVKLPLAAQGAAESRDGAPSAAVQAAVETARDKYATLATVFVFFLLLLAVMTISAFFEDYVNEVVRLRILMDVRRDLCAKLLDQPVSFYDGAHRGDVVQRVMDDVGGFAAGLRLVFQSLPEGTFNLIAGILVLSVLSGTLTIVCLAGLVLFLPMRRFTKKVKKQALKRQMGSARRVEVLLQMVSGIRTVKAFRSEDRKVAEFHEADRDVYRLSLKVQRTKSLSDASSEFVNNGLVMLLAVGSSFLVLRGTLALGPGEMLLFLTQLANLYRPAKRLIRDVNGMSDAMASVDRVFEILDLPPPTPDPADAVAFHGIRHAIRFEHVGFHYKPGLPVLEDVSFEVGRGQTVALVGPSGGGKSTLCDLLLRFYDPTEGRITVDGVAVAHFKRATFLDRTAVVTQDPFLFHTTILENLRLGKPDAAQAEIESAARAAQIHEHVASLPQGYLSEVGERGARLSGGQRQRITIARALLRDPNILVLDEATASLDTASERAVQEALDRLREGRTTLVVAHRLSTVRRADRIVVLDRGRVVDQGTHEELLTRGGLYARLCAMQDVGGGPGYTDAVPAVAPAEPLPLRDPVVDDDDDGDGP